MTFNFDTLIEERFRKEIAAAFKEESSGFPRIIHVHGKLGPTPTVPERGHLGDYSQEWVEWLSSSASSINVVMDSIDEKTLKAAREAVAEAKILCFLGFAFATRNLERLGLPGLLARAQSPEKCFGTAYGLLTGERNPILSKFYGKLELGNEDQDCRSVLRKLNVFID